MYPPAHFQMTDRQHMLDTIRQYNFASVTAFHNGQYHVAHIPLILKTEADTSVLYGHFDAQNPVLTAIAAGVPLSLVFNGPNAFISSTWYDSKQASTWNYLMVTVQSRAEILPATALPGLLDELIAQEEADNPDARQLSQLPDDYVAALLPHITAVRMPINHMRGVNKMSQNKPAFQRQQIIKKLLERGDSSSLAVAERMKRL